MSIQQPPPQQQHQPKKPRTPSRPVQIALISAITTIVVTIITAILGPALLKSVNGQTSPTPTTSPVTSTPTPTPSPTPALPGVTITSPADQAIVNLYEIISGTSQNIPEGSVIWIVIQTQNGSYYPQQRPALVDTNGDWTSPVSIGDQNSSGQRFTISAILADKEAQTVFTKYLQTAQKSNDYPGLNQLPNGARIYSHGSHITVTRN